MRKLLTLLLLASSAFAEERVSPDFYQLLKEGQALQQKGAHSKALPKLNVLLQKADTPFERALAQGYLAFSLAALGRHREAIERAREALEFQKLPSHFQRELLRLLLLSSLALERFSDALQFGRELEGQGGQLDPETRYWLAYAAYRLKRYREAMAQVERALASTGEPREEWSDLLLAIALEGRRYREALPLLKRRLEQDPKSTKLWKQLAALYLEMGREHEALASLVLAYHLDHLSSEDLLRIVNLHAHLHIPEKAARLVREWRREKRLPTSRRILDLEYRLWLAARSWREAAETLASLGGDPLQIAKLYLEAEEFQQARLWAERAGRSAERDLILAVALYRLGDLPGARNLLSKIRSPKLKGIRDYWLRCLESQRVCL